VEGVGGYVVCIIVRISRYELRKNSRRVCEEAQCIGV
jgi:hypothetical protein